MKKRKYLKYIITLTVGLVIAFLICILKNIFQQDNINDVYHILVDAFFVSGIMILCYGLLVLAANGGTFTIITYGIRRFFGMFRKDISKELHKDYAEYKLARLEDKKPIIYLVLCGLILILISFIFLIPYYNTLQ